MERFTQDGKRLVRFEVLLPAKTNECLRADAFRNRRTRSSIIKELLDARYAEQEGALFLSAISSETPPQNQSDNSEVPA